MFLKRVFIYFLLFLSIICLKLNIAHSEVYQLDNGFRYILKKDTLVPLVVMQLWIKHGSIDELDEEAGFAHFLEHLTFRSKDIAKRIENLGGDINAYTSLDRTVYYLTLPMEHYEVGLHVLYDIFAETNLDEKSFEEEKKVILEEMKRGYDNPQRMLYQNFFGTAFEKHPARRPVIGYENTIKNAKIEQVRDFYKRYYNPDSSFLVIVGDFDENKLKTKIKEIFSKKITNISELKGYKVDQENYNTPKISYKTMPVNSCYLMMGLPTVDVYSEFVAPVDVLSYIMGESSNSILTLKLKEEKQLVSYVYSYQMNTKDFGFFIVQANLSCENMKDATYEILNLLFKEELNINETKLKKVIRNYESNYYFSKEKINEQASDMGISFHYYKDPDYSRKYIDKINKVTVNDISNVRTLFFNPQKIVASFVIPDSQKANMEQISELIRNFGQKNNEIESLKLKNGLQIYIHRRSNVPTFGVSITSLAGTRLETNDTSGISNFTMANLLRGTKNYKYTEIIEKIENMGGSLSGFSTKNLSGIKGRFLSKDFYEAISLIGEIINNFEPPFEEIEKTKKLILLDIKKKIENPNRLLRDLYFKAMFGDLPLGLPTEGLEENVRKFSREDVIKHFRRIFSPFNTIIVLSGNIPADAMSYITKQFDDLEGEDNKYCIIAKPDPQQKYISQAYDFNQTHIMMGIPVPGMVSKENIYFQLISTILSNQSGRLFVNLRDNQGLAYALGAFLYNFPETSLFTLYIATSPENTEKAVNAMIEELRNIITYGFTDEELEKAKRKLIIDSIESSQSNIDYAFLLSQNALIHNDIMYHKVYEGFLKQVEKKDLIDLAKKYIKVDKIVKVIIHGKSKGDIK